MKIMELQENMNYTDAYQELMDIVQEIENGDISVDVLSEKVKRASMLLRFCKEKLKQTEVDVDQILKDLSEES
jgi:exodeoxyribonuclease VII small subunit